MRRLIIAEQNNKVIHSRFAWPFALLIVSALVMTESSIFGTGYNAKFDWSFIYVTMRFVFLPVACIAHAGLNLFRIIKKEPIQILQFSSIVISLGYLVSLYFHPLPLTVWK